MHAIRNIQHTYVNVQNLRFFGLNCAVLLCGFFSLSIRFTFNSIALLLLSVIACDTFFVVVVDIEAVAAVKVVQRLK